MSSTRKAKDGSVFHQNRYASSPEFERGLLGNLVAKRVALLDDKADRELIWFIQYLSHQEGGIGRLAEDLIQQFPDQIQTKEMAELKLKPGKVCSPEQVRKIRHTLPDSHCQEFLLKGEIWDYSERITKPAPTTASSDWDSSDASEIAEAARRPASYGSNDFFEMCGREAENNLERELCQLCLDPASALNRGPWYFPGLIHALRAYLSSYQTSKLPVFTTALGQKVNRLLDYTIFARGLTLAEGEARRGKSFAAQSWCEQRPGRARFIEVPTGNDEIGFFRALARGLGLGNLSRYKACDIKDRVENVLLSGDLLLVLDEAQRLWPQRYLRDTFPSRVVWIMTMANAGVPVAMLATPQFTTTQKAVEKTGWNSAQLTGRIKHYEPLPADLSQEDLIGVAKAFLPEADAGSLRALSVYACASARYIAAIESISKMARFLAKESGRDAVTTADIKKAMNESVIPADRQLHNALAQGRKERRLPARTAADENPQQAPRLQSDDFSRPVERQQLTRSGPVEAPSLDG